MLDNALELALFLILALAWRQSREQRDPRRLRRRLLATAAGAIGLRLAMDGTRAAEGPLQLAFAIASAALALATAWPFLHEVLAGHYRRGERPIRLLLLVAGAIATWQVRSGLSFAAFFMLAVTRHPWLDALDTRERFRAMFACLALTVGLAFASQPLLPSSPWVTQADEFARLVRGMLVFSAATGVFAAFGAFTKDPTLGIRRVSRRLVASHVLVVTIPLLLLATLWVSSTYLGVNADRAIVASRALARESGQMAEQLRSAIELENLEGVALTVGRARQVNWPGTRAFAIRNGEVNAILGDTISAQTQLAGWMAGLDTLPTHGIVKLAGQRYLGASARRQDGAVVLLVPVQVVFDSTLSLLVSGRVRMASGGAVADARAPSPRRARALRDSLQAADAQASDSITGALLRRMATSVGVPDSAIRMGRRSSPVTITTFSDTIEAGGGEGGLTGFATAKGVRFDGERWVEDEFGLIASASFRASLSGLFANVSENPLQLIPITALIGLALMLLPIVHTDLRMVRGMGSSITTGIAALRDGALAFGSGRLEYRIPVRGDDELWDTARQFNQMAGDLERARALEQERARYENELELARRIQARLLPASPPVLAGLDIAGLSESAREVGGDYFDHLDLGGGRVLLVVADVSGKGVPAALLMSGFRASLLSQDSERTSLDAIASRLNDFLHRSVEPGRFVTAFLGFLDAATGHFVYVNAGHNPPVLLRRNGDIEMLTQGGLILGILADSTFTCGETVLAPGDLVALYTDGVTEGANASAEQWGEERLAAALKAASLEPAARIAKRIVRDVRLFEGDTGPADDITVLVAKRTATT